MEYYKKILQKHFKNGFFHQLILHFPGQLWFNTMRKHDTKILSEGWEVVLRLCCTLETAGEL